MAKKTSPCSPVSGFLAGLKRMENLYIVITLRAWALAVGP